MKRVLWQIILLALLAIGARAQCALDYFTNQASVLLQAQFGFGVTNIPVYCATNPAIGYSSAIHYQLQSVANAYDATTPATNLPSVFRPLFSWQSGTLYIIGYTCVSNDFQSQIARGFKNLQDFTITTNDNVWGIPWVVGTKGNIPVFNEYCYASEVAVNRELYFLRYPGPSGTYLANRPPQYTNQYYLMSISNAFGAELWNPYLTPFTNSISIVMSNLITITITNDYNFESNLTFTNCTNWSAGSSWGPQEFRIPMSMTNITLPLSYWSESTGQFIPLQSNGTNGFLASDSHQTGFPVHHWTLNITNNLIYALVDNQTGCVLDFVNLGAFGSSLNLMQLLEQYAGNAGIWQIAPANDLPNSPISYGVLAEIGEGMAANPQFASSLLGINGGYPASIGEFTVPSNPSQSGEQVSPGPGYACLIQSFSWQASDPLVHYTVQDLTNIFSSQGISVGNSSLPISLDNSICSLGEVNPNYNSGVPEYFQSGLSDDSFQMGFFGAPDLPYQIWASTNLVDWSQLGTAAQPLPGQFEFEDTATGDYPARFYQVRAP